MDSSTLVQKNQPGTDSISETLNFIRNSKTADSPGAPSGSAYRNTGVAQGLLIALGVVVNVLQGLRG